LHGGHGGLPFTVRVWSSECCAAGRGADLRAGGLKILGKYAKTRTLHRPFFLRRRNLCHRRAAVLAAVTVPKQHHLTASTERAPLAIGCNAKAWHCKRFLYKKALTVLVRL